MKHEIKALERGRGVVQPLFDNDPNPDTLTFGDSGGCADWVEYFEKDARIQAWTLHREVCKKKKNRRAWEKRVHVLSASEFVPHLKTESFCDYAYGLVKIEDTSLFVVPLFTRWFNSRGRGVVQPLFDNDPNPDTLTFGDSGGCADWVEYFEKDARIQAWTLHREVCKKKKKTAVRGRNESTFSRPRNLCHT